jgi:hypothetical protein
MEAESASFNRCRGFKKAIHYRFFSVVCPAGCAKYLHPDCGRIILEENVRIQTESC